jgi:hypothetical protein
MCSTILDLLPLRCEGVARPSRNVIRRIALAVMGVSLTLVAPAVADPPDQPPGGRVGIEKAKQAGIYVDPQAE